VICPPCKVRRHSECKRGTWCDCQHKQPVPAQSALFPINQPTYILTAAKRAEIKALGDMVPAMQLKPEAFERITGRPYRVYSDEYGDRMAP
jgi:hypothetical protein